MMEEPSASVQKTRLKLSQQSSARSAKCMVHLGPPPVVPSITDASLQLIRFTPRDIKKRWETLDIAKAMGPDNILAIVLKTCTPELAAPLAKLFHCSYNTGIYSGKLT
eukprot:g30061.t1